MPLTKLLGDIENYIGENGYKFNIDSPNLARRLRAFNYQERRGKPAAFYMTIQCTVLQN